jgi:heat shock protein HtpX
MEQARAMGVNRSGGGFMSQATQSPWSGGAGRQPGPWG